MKYNIDPFQEEVLPNRLGLTDEQSVAREEFKGFSAASEELFEKLSGSTKFNLNYIKKIHLLALRHLYSFAGEWRQVNLQKGSFMFPAAQFLPSSMKTFEQDILLRLPTRYANDEELIRSLATVHGEFLFIHPFREGNGRTARLLADLMLWQKVGRCWNFSALETPEGFQRYIIAVQACSGKNYSLMTALFSGFFYAPSTPVP